MEVIIKVSALGILGSVLVIVMRRTLPEMAVPVSLAILSVLFFCGVGALGSVVTTLYELAELAGVGNEFIKPVIKTLGISIMTKLSSDICRENALLAASSYIEFLGGAVAISFAIPLMFGILEQMST